MAKSFGAKRRRAKRREEANPHRSSNPDMAQAMVEIRRSSAASPQDGKSRTTRTRSAQNKGAIRDSTDE